MMRMPTCLWREASAHLSALGRMSLLTADSVMGSMLKARLLLLLLVRTGQRIGICLV